MIKVRGYFVPVDVRAEIEAYEWEQPTWRGDRLIACSPFREERSPSFAVNFENGTFIDSGGDGEYRVGNFVKLLAFLRNETYDETADYLISLYSPELGEIDRLELPDISDWMGEEENRTVFPREAIEDFRYVHPYLENRGIPQNVQRAFDVGYDPKTQSVVLVWHNVKGEIVSWKQRSVNDKKFWYVKGGQPIRNHLFGIHWVVKRGFKKVWIVESEIDALTLWSKGIPAVAIGTSYLSKQKRDLLLQVGVEELVIATDNDKDGRKALQSIVKQLAGHMTLYRLDWTDVPHKDVNDARNELHIIPIVEIDPLVWE